MRTSSRAPSPPQMCIRDREQFESELLKQIQNEIISEYGARDSIKKLNLIGGFTNIRYNQMAYIIIASFFMWDYHCVDAFLRWKNTYGTRIKSWMLALGEVEALISLTVISNTKENYCFPVITEIYTPNINIREIAHPLIEENKMVTNSIELNADTCIITGSNMSGKTTFLRSIGVNLVLAYAGGCVCAKEFTATCMRIFTSMRIQDDVSKETSTFYAEILRIKLMATYTEEKTPMIVLIDEIFKGTNSADRIIGAKGAINKLSKPWVLSIVSTHDFELCDLENDKEIKAINYHFSEYYVDDKIYFDYTLKEGRCITTNAQYLLRMAGLL